MLSLQRQFVGPASALLSLLEDDAVTDLLINGLESSFVERNGVLCEALPVFKDKAAINDFIERLLIPIGKRIDAAHPYLDGKLADGSRFHIILPPIAPQGPLISIRKLKNRLEPIPLSAFADARLCQWLEQQVHGRKNILIAGGTGCGKTTLLSRLIERIYPEERIALVEETCEISAEHPHLIRLEARAASPDGTGEVSLRDLIRNTLRMRPDRLILGECRGAEAFDMLQAMNTGHAGSLCTLHANGARDALRRLESLVLLSGLRVPLSAVRDWIAHTIHIVVYLERAEGVRTIREVVAVQGLEGEVYRILPYQSMVRLGCQL